MPARGLDEPLARRLPHNRFELRRGSWRGEYDMRQLPAWLALYRRLAARNAAVYAPVVEALEALPAQPQPDS